MPALAGKIRSLSTTKADRIEARLPRETKIMIEHAARLAGMSASDFVITHAHEAARSVIFEHERWRLDRVQSETFVEALLNPPEPNEALRRAAKRYRAR